MRIPLLQLTSVALVFVLAATLGACTSPPVNYTTQLDRTGGLGPGDPVIHAATPIGHITSVAPIGGGDTEIGFQVEGAHSSEVHQDAIMLLDTQPGTPSLEVLNQDAMSSPAPSGMRLDGASDMNQAQMIMMSRGPGSLATALTNSMTAFPPSGAQSSQSTAQMQQMLNEITRQTTSMAMAVAPPPNPADLARMQTDAEAVERQFTRNGKPQQADSVHQQMDQILTGYGAHGTPAPSSTP